MNEIKNKKVMKILFSEPISSMEAVWGKFGKASGTNNFLYGIASVVSYCKSKGFDNITFIDPNIEGMGKEEYIQYLKENQFDIVAMSSFTASVSHVFNTIKIIKETLPNCITVLGGIHATLMPEESMAECAALDFVTIGEGEVTFYELIDFILSNPQETNYGSIAGLVWRSEEGLIRNVPRPIIPDIDVLPMPAYEVFPMEKYEAQATHSKVFPTYIMLVSRGCCYQCAFCNATDVHGRRVRFKSPEVAIEEMVYLKEQYGAKGITFYDSTFTVNRQWVVEFCNLLIEKNLGIYWNCSTRTDCLDTKLLSLMKKSGCWSISFGIESGNQKSLDVIQKNNRVETNTKTVKLALKMGFFVAATYIICIPGEDEQDVLNTIKYAKKLGAHQSLFYLPVPYPKTPLYEICKAEGGLNKDISWTDYNALDFDNPVYVNPKIGKEKMKELYNYAFKTYYKTPKVILRNLAQINSTDALKKYWMAAKCFFKFKNKS